MIPKYRVWIKSEYKMYKVSQINFGWNFNSVHLSDLDDAIDFPDGNPLIVTDDVVLMQWAGRYDKNKSPIYEGDIIKRTCYYGNPESGIYQGIEKEDVIEPVKSLEDYFTELGRWEETATCERDEEIIGNIYQDSHLLKEDHVQN